MATPAIVYLSWLSDVDQILCLKNIYNRYIKTGRSYEKGGAVWTSMGQLLNYTNFKFDDIHNPIIWNGFAITGSPEGWDYWAPIAKSSALDRPDQTDIDTTSINLSLFSKLSPSNQIRFLKNYTADSRSYNIAEWLMYPRYGMYNPSEWAGFIKGSFVFAGTPEGYAYWEELAGRAPLEM